MEFSDYVTSGLAFAMLWLALKQHAFQKKIETKRSNNDFHAVKMEMYDAARTLISKVFSYGTPNQDDVQEYKFATMDASFYFDDDIQEYLSGILKDANKIIYWNEKAKVEDNNEESLRKTADIQGKLVAELVDGHFKKKFKPYLDVGAQ